MSRSLLPGVAAVLVLMLAPVRSTLRRGLTSAFLAVSFAPLLRCTRCAGILHQPPLGSVLSEMMQSTHIRARCGYSEYHGVLTVPTRVKMRRACKVVCNLIYACHSNGTCTVERRRARRGRRQERGVSTADEGPCTSDTAVLLEPHSVLARADPCRRHTGRLL